MFVTSKGPKQSIFGSFLRVAILWLIVSHVAIILANAIGLAGRPVSYFITAGFAIHSLMALLSVVGSSGGRWRIPISVIGACLIFIGFRATPNRDFDDLRKSAAATTENLIDWLQGKNQSLQRMKAVDHLSAAARLIFEEDTRSSRVQARQHLLAISAREPEYPSAQALLQVAEQSDSPESQLEVLKRDQKEGRLVVTLRNNGGKPVRNIQYMVSYFEISSGLRIKSEATSKIPEIIRPLETWTFEIPNHALKAPAHAAFALVDWETVAGS